MNPSDLGKIALTVLASLGGGGAIVLGMSNWLGKIWADRLMQKEKAHYESQLEDFKARLNRESERTTQTFREKLSLYKEALEPVLELVMYMQLDPSGLTPELTKEFEKKRLKTTALLGMFATISAFESYNSVVDYLFDSLEGKRQFHFDAFRVLGFQFLTAVRQDVGIADGELVYRGRASLNSIVGVPGGGKKTF